MGNLAFELAAEYAGTVEQIPEEGADPVTVDVYQGGVIAIPPDQHNFDVKDELAKGEGVIVVPDSQTYLVERLREYPALKEVPAGDREPTVGTGHMSYAQLRDELKRLGLSATGSKAVLQERLENHLAGVAAGDQEAADNPDDTNEEA